MALEDLGPRLKDSGEESASYSTIDGAQLFDLASTIPWALLFDIASRVKRCC